jgi:hypothetical protein
LTQKEQVVLYWTAPDGPVRTGRSAVRPAALVVFGFSRAPSAIIHRTVRVECQTIRCEDIQRLSATSTGSRSQRSNGAPDSPVPA